MLDVAITIEENIYLLRVSAKILNISEVAVNNLLPSLTSFLLHHVQKPSTINLADWSRVGQ